ncbi:hypothetical protein [Candidatus Albibeggiatoa sp. nov. BB20]|uniref:hypothetical protein n=1 Tax=Candidatus Albibeggiatoa sp. nov. BB20 TaxID=3162723 RepID=UPI00336573C4
MNIKRFTQIIEAYGADSNRWPESERQAALALLTISTEAQKMLQQADVLDNFLNTVAVNSPSLQLQQGIFDAVARSPKPDDAWQELIDWLFGTTWQQHLLRPALALLLPLILGIFLGVQLTTVEDTPLTQEALWQTEMNLLAFDMNSEW